MECHICPVLLLILTLDSVCANDRFFISAPNVFHVGVKEKVFVQMGESLLNRPVTLHLENEIGGQVVSETITITCTENEPIKTVELMIDREEMSKLPVFKDHPYLLLVAKSPSLSKKSTRVLVSQHRGYIFIQTDQPIYNPTQKVMYRIFTLDHTLRPHVEFFQISIINAAGNRIMKSLKTANGGILSGQFIIPDVSEMGTWKIVAHYEGDEAHAATREFKVQKFVLPSFEVTIGMEQSYLLLNAPKLNFTISALYSYGETVKGAYHCRFGVITKGFKDGQKMKPVFIRGLELTGSVQDGKATAILQTAELNKHLQDQLEGKTLSDLEQSGAELYLAVSVTNIQSGELQEAEVSIPIISHIYTIDLSRTRSHFIPGVPLDVVVVIRLPDGSPAAGVPVEIHVPTSQEKSSQATTNQQGAVFAVFNIPDAEVAVEVSVDGQQQRKVIQRASSPSDCFLYLSFTNRIYSVGESLTVTYLAINGPPNGFIYYMVFSRGSLIKQDFLRAGTTTRDNLLITPDMVPSFRLIGYYYNQRGDIIADSVWVDVKAECEKKVEVSSKMHQFYPGKQAVLEFNLHGQKAKVALLAVDKAIYALNAHNKLTAKQVFSSMQSYDTGCSYGGGSNTDSTLNDAGLSLYLRVGCHSHSARQRRSLDLQQEMMILKSNFSSEKLQECCVRGLSLIPMRRTCEERANRVSQVKADPLCAEAFLECCRQGEKLRQRLRQEDAKKGLGRTANALEIEEFFFDTTNQYIRRYFPPSFAFTTFDVNGKKSYSLSLPDSITTWEIQAISLSATHGFCVAEPYEFRTFKEVFVSLRLPYSVKKYEQIAIEPVIYNYGDNPVQLAVHMEQSKGLCSPGSATSTAFVNITVEPQSSSFVSFSAVPMVTGTIPIKIRLYDIEQERGIDAIEKTLNVWTEGIVQTVEETVVVKLDGSGTKSLTIDGNLPDNTVPDSNSNIFIKMEGDGFGESSALRLLSPEGVAALLKLPGGCGEQTMRILAPTALALRYLDINQQWFELPAGTRDVALQNTEEGSMRILTFKKADGSYGAWTFWPSSTWLTGLVVKVLSLLAERQAVITGQQGRQAKVVSEEDISHSVRYLLAVQNDDGSFTDPHPVMDRDMQGGIRGKEEEASTTAFITIALYRSLQFLKVEEQNNTKASILKSTTYLLSHLEELKSPYAVAITTYCLSVCLSVKEDALSAWAKLEGLATVGEDGCHMWGANAEKVADAFTVETTAYALLAAVALEKSKWAEGAACWLTSQENYGGGFKSTQDTIVALEALSEYELKRPSRTFTQVAAQFTIPGRREKEDLSLENRKEKVEKELKKMIGNNINVLLTGQGEAKLKVVKAYHLLEPMDKCEQLSIKVTVEGKVKYTARIMENYDYYDEDYSNDEAKEGRVPRSAIEWFDARTRYRRDADPSPDSENTVSYKVCVSYSLSRNLTGMAIADITLLSGFEAVTEDLDTLKLPPEQYISHYEISYGRVLIYFNNLEQDTCIAFDAIQRVPVGLLQPAPASFYDYYEPNRKCTVFYSAPQRSKMVSKLCSEDVCQCAERPCHKIKSVFEPVNGKKITLEDRSNHACFFPIADYGYAVEVVSVSVKSNFELYTTNVTEVLRAHGDMHVNVNDVRVFVKRLQCKGQLQTGKRYLILGKDGTTTDSNGKMQYLLESNTWVEQRPDERKCKRQSYRAACKGLNDFLSEYKINGCRQ
ncbi:complement C4-B [Centroberyx affinis]|uniref:complement C4-B n=1 Tax=Centroberyx affinis TaxID=166261 RepID=UPI003A5C0DB4